MPAAVLAASLAPLAAGALIPQHVMDGDGAVLCPLRAMAGVPCPLCGATRAFVAAGHGDTEFLSFNGYWVLLSLGAAAVAAAVLLSDSSAERVSQMLAGVRKTLRTSPALALLALVLLGAPGWIWAIIQRDEVLS